MTDNMESLVLEQIKAIRADLAAARDDLRALTHRTARLERAMAGLRRDQAHTDETKM